MLFNEEEQKLEAVETDINGNIASAVVEHLSTYILINRIVFEKSFTWIDVWDDSSKHSATVLAAQNKGLNVYAVGLGDNNSSYFNNYLKPLAEDTGGAFYLASNASQLTEIYNDINQKIDIETDSDGDGLLDGKEIVVAPIDPNPLKANGPTGIWERQATLKEKEVISTEYTDGRGLDVDEITELIRDAIGKDFPNNKEIADTIVELIIKLRDPLNDNEEIIRPMALLVKYFSRTKAHEVVGAYFLNFIYDADYVAYHSQPETWQRYFGFNDFYDDVFRIATNMNNLRFDFSDGKEDYALWMWKGDYWNLHSGAEVGLYVSPTEYSGTDHYDVIDFELPMKLSLYNYDSNDADKTDCLFRWAPEIKQWWVTGFNPKYKDPNPNVMVAVGSIDFTGYEDIYNGLKNAKNDYDVDSKKSYEDYLIFDDYNYTVWINWYKGVK